MAKTWLGAVSIHSKDFDLHARSALSALLDMYPLLHTFVNHFDEHDSQLLAAKEQIVHSRMYFSFIPIDHENILDSLKS